MGNVSELILEWNHLYACTARVVSHRSITLPSIWEFTLVKSHSNAKSAGNYACLYYIQSLEEKPLCKWVHLHLLQNNAKKKNCYLNIGKPFRWVHFQRRGWMILCYDTWCDSCGLPPALRRIPRVSRPPHPCKSQELTYLCGLPIVLLHHSIIKKWYSFFKVRPNTYSLISCIF